MYKNKSHVKNFIKRRAERCRPPGIKLRGQHLSHATLRQVTRQMATQAAQLRTSETTSTFFPQPPTRLPSFRG